MKVALPREFYVEKEVDSRYIGPYSGKPAGHSVLTTVMRVPGAYLYRRAERYTQHCGHAGYSFVNNISTWTVQDNGVNSKPGAPAEGE